MKQAYIYISFLLLCCATISSAQSVLPKLKQILPGATFTKLDNGHHFKEEFIIMLPQPLDHDNPEAGTFMQRIFLAHYHQNEPMVMATEGYSAYPRYYELSDIILSNQMIVEYRFFGESKPENYDYKYLTNDQAVEDYHRIRKLFGKLYSKDWISTGISKGGTTCLIYKAKYPKDVKVCVPYVAPLPMAREDKRCNNFILEQGSSECQSKLKEFQETLLDQKVQLIPMVDSLAKIDSLEFSQISTAQAFEYAVLEFTFSFWQYGHDCESIPESPNIKQSFDYLNEIVGFDFYCDESVNYFAPAFYQFMTENGYYGFIHDYLVDDIEYVSDFTNLPFAPEEAIGKYDQEYLKFVRVYLYHKGDKILYIHGALDPWSACKLNPSPNVDALLMIDKDGDHKTRISSFTKEEQTIMYKKLATWLKRDLHKV